MLLWQGPSIPVWKKLLTYDEIVKFLRSIGLYKSLRDVNMPEEEIEALAKQSMVLPDYQGNPRVATLEEMTELVKEAYYQS
jgi:alcohol dehydrogenase class IV